MGVSTGALMAVSTATSALSTAATAYNQAQTAKMQGDIQKSQYEANARMANLQAEDAIKRGDKEALAHKKKVRQLIGAQRAALAAQGIEVDSGSALDVQMDTAALGGEDILTIKNNAWREAWGYRVQAEDYRNKGTWAKMSGRNEARNTLLTGGMTIAKDVTAGLYSYEYGKTTKTTKTTKV